MRIRYAAFLPLSLALSIGCAAVDGGVTPSSVEEPIDVVSTNSPKLLLTAQQIADCYDEANGKIIVKAIQLMSPAPSPLGLGTGVVETLEACHGYRRRFQYGTIFYVSGQAAAYSVHGDIGAKYFALGEHKSPLGYPTTDESGTPDGIGRFNHFEQGSIYWKPNLGPHALWGAIRAAWAAGGWERNPNLGYPITDQIALGSDGKDQMVSFENGVVYKVPANPKAQILFGGAVGEDPVKVRDEIIAAVKAKVVSEPSLEVLAESVVTTSDYSREGFDTVHNRRFTITFFNIYHTPGPTSDAGGSLTLTIELQLNGHEIDYRLVSWSAQTSDSGLYSQTVVDGINDKLHAVIDPIVGPQFLRSVASNVIAIKPMSDASLNVYMTPWD